MKISQTVILVKIIDFEFELNLNGQCMYNMKWIRNSCFGQCSTWNESILMITFSYPRAQPEVHVVIFLVSSERRYFSHYNPKFSASYSLYLDVSRKCTHFQYTILIFLCVFMTASSPVSNIYFWRRGENKSKIQLKLCKICPRGQGRSV